MNLFKKKKGVDFLKRHAIHSLNLTQFLGVVNDNFFKYLIVFLLIELQGIQETSMIMTTIGIVYVLPFLLFSSYAGLITDQFSKKWMIFILKLTELIIMIFGIVAFSFKSSWASYSLLFLLSVQSAFFSPPKYSIIPELVKNKAIPKANGLITSFTYLGIIVGTFLASLLTQMTGKNFPLCGSFSTLIAGVGLIASLLIPNTEAQGSKRKASPYFVREVYHTLCSASKTPQLLASIFGAASFLFVGAFFQLNVIPFAVESLGYHEVAGGYLFLITAIGIAIGALLGGMMSRHRPEIGFAAIAGLMLSLTTSLLGILYRDLIFVFIALFALGLFGGLFIVPFESYIQRFAPKIERGRIVGALNFLSFCGVLIAPLLLFLFSNILKLSAASGFIVTGGILLTIVLTLGASLPTYFFNAASRLLIFPIYNLKEQPPIEGREETQDQQQEKKSLYLFRIEKWSDLLFLSTLTPKLQFFFPEEAKHRKNIFLHLIPSLRIISVEDGPSHFLSKASSKGIIPCLLIPKRAELSVKRLLMEIKKGDAINLISISLTKNKRSSSTKGLYFSRRNVRFLLKTHR